MLAQRDRWFWCSACEAPTLRCARISCQSTTCFGCGCSACLAEQGAVFPEGGRIRDYRDILADLEKETHG